MTIRCLNALEFNDFNQLAYHVIIRRNAADFADVPCPIESTQHVNDM